MRYFLLAFWSFVFFRLSAHESGARAGTSVTRAVVVGISYYEDQRIPELQYAASDARAFYRFLRSDATGWIDSSNIHLLLDRNARLWNIVYSLKWLKNTSSKGDNAIIYFSGHGDEKDSASIKQPFLLAYDTRKDVYQGSALSIDLIRMYVDSLSAKGIKVSFIADACRSGSFAKMNSSGIRQLNGTLSTSWARETKILSCKPGQVSYEGLKWSGGVFTHYLIDGLEGMADENGDRYITLSELKNYLMTSIGKSTNGMQTPSFSSSLPEDTLSFVHITTGNATQVIKNSKTEVISGSRSLSRSSENAYVNDSILALCSGIEHDIADGRLICGRDTCAWAKYELLAGQKNCSPNIIGMIQGKLASALMGQAQKVINGYLEGKEEYDCSDYSNAAEKVEKALSLMGGEFILADMLKSRMYFLQARAIIYTRDTFLQKEIIKKLNLSIRMESGAAFSYNALGLIDFYNQKYSKAIQEFNRALELAPGWCYAISNLGSVYAAEKDYQKAAVEYNKAIEINPDDYSFYYLLGVMYYSIPYMEEKAIPYFTKSIELEKSRIHEAYSYIYLADINIILKNYPKALEYCRKALAHDSHYALAYQYIGTAYLNQNRYDSAISYFKLAINNDSTFRGLKNAGPFILLANAYLALNLLSPAGECLSRAKGIDSSRGDLYNAYANLFLKQNQLEQAVINFRKAISLNSEDTSSLRFLAEIYYTRKEYKEALDYYKMYLERAPKDTIVPAIIARLEKKAGSRN